MKREWIAWIVLLCFLSIGVSGAVLGAENSRYQEALKLFEQAKNLPPDDLVNKEYLYRKALELYPNFPEALNNLGNVYETLQRYDKANEYYKKAIAANPKLSAPYFGLGDIAFTIGNYQEAQRWYEKGLQLDPGDEIARDRIALIDTLTQTEKRVISAEEIIAIFAPIVKRGVGGVSARPVSINFPESVLPFDYNSAAIREDARKQLDEIGKALSSKELAGATFEIAGHTCNIGSEGYNQVLSEKRAESVRRYLIEHFPIEPKRLVALGYGETRPIADNTTEEGRRKNRRVEIRMMGEGNLLPELTLQVAFLYLKNGQKIPLPQGTVLTSEDNYQIFFKAPQDCYVYIFQEDSSGKMDQLFPNPNFTPVDNPIRAGQEYWIPGKNSYFFLDENPGEEKIYVLATWKRAIDIEEVAAQIAKRGEGSAELYERLLLRGVKGVIEEPVTVGPPEERKTPALSRFPSDFYLVFSFYNGGKGTKPKGAGATPAPSPLRPDFET